jgi:HK97 family phage prohead protease
VGDKAEWLRIGVGGIVPIHLDSVAEKDDTGPGTVTGWASVYNVVDQQDEIVIRGAFAKTIKDWAGSNRVIPLTNGHDNSPAGVIGSVKSLSETPYGLKLAGSYSSAPSAQDVRMKAKEGHVNGLSIFGGVINKSYETRDGRDISILHEVGLMAVGLTPMPVNSKALITASKSLKADDEDSLSEVWICDMKSALAITSKAVRKTAVDLLVKSAYPTIVAATGSNATGDTTDVVVKANALDEASVYALGIIGESGPGTSSPGGEPSDSLADLLALEQVATTSELDAMLRDFGQSAKG